MKIIKHGVCVKTYRGTCQACGCVFECDKSETRTGIHHKSMNDSKLVRIIGCPDCDHNVCLPEDGGMVNDVQTNR